MIEWWRFWIERFWIEGWRLMIQWWHVRIKWLGDLSDGVKVLFDILASVGTLAAAILAAVTIRQAKKQAKKSQDALLLERRVDFRLDLLKELASFNLRGVSTAYADAEIRQRAKMLPIDLVPLTRAAVHLESTEAATDLVSSRGQRDNLREEIAEELLQAVTTTLTLEGSPEDHRPTSTSELQR